MTRISVGWRLVKDGASVLRADRSLLIFPALAIVGAYVGLFVVAGVGAGVASAVGVAWLVIPFLLAGCYLAVFVVVYSNVALALATSEVMDGHDVTVVGGLHRAWPRFGQSGRWAGVQLGVGLIAGALGSLLNDASGTRIGSVATSVVGFAWSLGSFFVIPVIAFEGLGPRAALDRSGELVEQRWGEALTGRTGISLVVFLLATLPVCALFGLGSALEHTSTAGSVTGYTLGVLALVVAFAVGSALGVVFRVELYRYATDGKLTGGFAKEDVESVFGSRLRPAG
jgi:hypothetical protein